MSGLRSTPDRQAGVGNSRFGPTGDIWKKAKSVPGATALGRALNTMPEHLLSHHRPLLAVVGDRECCMLPPHQGAQAMSSYKAYLISPDGHHIKAVDLDCADDHAAKNCAEQLTDFNNVELWEHARRVARFGSKISNNADPNSMVPDFSAATIAPK
jgi:hypothetical protein